MKTKIGIIVGVFAIASLLATSALAANTKGGTRPGNGYGDQNHVHTGPPGQGGFGYGGQSHPHGGPPGQNR